MTPIAAEKLKSKSNNTPVKAKDNLVYPTTAGHSQLFTEPRFKFCSLAAFTDDEVEERGGDPAVPKITNLQMLLATEVIDHLSATAAKRTLLEDVKVSL